MKVALDRSRCLPQELGGLGHASSLHVNEHEDLSLRASELHQGQADAPLQTGIAHRSCRFRFGVTADVEKLHQAAPCRPFSCAAVSLMHQHTVKPGRKLRLATESRQRTKRFQESLLSNVLRQCVVATHQSPGQSNGHVSVALYKATESVFDFGACFIHRDGGR